MPSRVEHILKELRRRRVYHVAIAYVAVGLGILGASEVILDPLDLGALRPAIVVLTLLGFPIAIVLAWAYELRPEEPEEREEPAEPAASGEAVGVASPAVRLTPEAEAAADVSSARSIAVLPFVNMSPDPDTEFFCDGVAEEIINALAQVPELRVAGRTSAFSFKGSGQDLREIGAQLKVASVLEGSVRASGNQLRITAQLIDTSSGYHLWSERFDRTLEDVFAIQEEIATSITDRLKLTIAGTPIRARPRPQNLRAYEAYLKGRALLYQRGVTMFQARACFEEALAHDPEYALAHAGLADSYSILGYYGLVPPLEAWPDAIEAARRAVALAPDLAEAHNALAIIAFARDWDWADASREFQRSIELNASYVQALTWHAMGCLQATSGEHEAAIAESTAAVNIDPLAPYTHTMLGYVLATAGRTGKAIEEAERGANSDPDSYWGQLVLATAYHSARRPDDAERGYRRALAISGRHPWALCNLARLCGDRDRRDQASAAYAELVARSGQEYVQPTCLAIAANSAGRTEEAFELLGRACEEHDSWLAWIGLCSPMSESLRALDAYGEILTRMKLPA